MGDLFSRAKQVIDQLIPVAEKLIKDGSAVDAVVKKRLSALTGGYGFGMLNVGRSPIDYSRTTTHIAYMYRTFSAHADWTYQALQLAPAAVTSALATTKPQIACIGRGPGSDIAGTLKFASEHNLKDRKFEFTVLDREPLWHRSREELLATYDGQVEVRHKSEALDLASGPPWVSSWDFVAANLFTFSFVLSEVWSFNKDRSVSQFLDRLISQANHDAVFCYIDNGGSKFTPLVEQEFDTRSDLKLIGSRDVERLFPGFDEQCDVLEDAYRGRFNERPKLTGNVAMRLWKKK